MTSKQEYLTMVAEMDRIVGAGEARHSEITPDLQGLTHASDYLTQEEKDRLHDLKQGLSSNPYYQSIHSSDQAKERIKKRREQRRQLATYEGLDRFQILVEVSHDSEDIEAILYVTESTHRPHSCRWEASDRDGNPSIFARTLDELIDEINELSGETTITITSIH